MSAVRLTPARLACLPPQEFDLGTQSRENPVEQALAAAFLSRMKASANADVQAALKEQQL
jgi:hypothetical protein